MAKNERSILEGLNFGAPAPAAEPVPQPVQPEHPEQFPQSGIFIRPFIFYLNFPEK